MPREDLPWGLGVARDPSMPRSCRLPGVVSLAIVLSADMVAADVLNITFKVVRPNGTETTLVISETYASNHLATVTAIKNDVDAVDNLSAALSGSNRTITITADGASRIEVITPVAIVHGGSGTATVSSTKSAGVLKIRGVSEKDPNIPVLLGFDNSTPPEYPANKSMASIVYQGNPAGYVNTAVQAGDPVYCLIEDYTDQAAVLNKRGTFRNNNDGGLAPVILVADAEFGDVDEGGLAPIAINQP